MLHIPRRRSAEALLVIAAEVGGIAVADFEAGAGGVYRREPQHGYGLALRKSFTIGTMTGMRCISVTWVVSGKMANRDAERGPMSPWVSPPFRRNISAMCASRTPSASPWMKSMGVL